MKQSAFIILIFLSLTSFAQENDSVSSANYIFIADPTPGYPGGHAEMIRFIKKNLREPAKSRRVQAKVYVGFVVNENGSLSDFEVIKGHSEPYDNAALELVKKMPNWIPAKSNDIPVRTKMVIPVSFD